MQRSYLFALLAVVLSVLLVGMVFSNEVAFNINCDPTKGPCRFPDACQCQPPTKDPEGGLKVYSYNNSTKQCVSMTAKNDSCNLFTKEKGCEFFCGSGSDYPEYSEESDS
nr:R.appendiculatus Kunitz/BPTI-like protein [Dermacentor andersoni]